MEGKGLLFKIFADIDVFDIEIEQKTLIYPNSKKNIVPL
jgi:malic enzyme